MRSRLSEALNTLWPSSIGLKRPPVETDDIRRLREEAETAYRRSAFSRSDYQDIVLEFMREAEERFGTPFPVDLAVSVCHLIEGLMNDESLIPFEIDWQVVANDAYAAQYIRSCLRCRKHFFSDYDRHMSIWREKVLWIVTGLLGYVPDHFFAADAAGSGPSFRVSLIDSVEMPAEAVERLIFTIFDDDLKYAGLMAPLREQLDNNALIASGIDPRDRYETKRSLVLPTEHKAEPPELVSRYLSGTPFEDFFETALPFSIPEKARFEHCHILGGTGHGKTQLLGQLVFSDLEKALEERRSVVLIDSQGDLIRTVSRLQLFSPLEADSLAERLVVIDPNDIEYPVSLNMFDLNRERIESYGPAEREKVLNGTIELYEYFFGALLGAELTQRQGVFFKYLARLMLEIPEANIHTLRDLMDDAETFIPYMEKLKGSARYFFEREFFDRSFAPTKKQIAKRLWGVLATPSFERMFAQPKNKVDLFELLNRGSIVLINTAKDLLKQEGSSLFGRFFISMITQAALERSVVPADERTPTSVFVDEAHEYFDDNIELILSQARKYAIGLVCAHQTLDQLSPQLRSAMISNTSTKCVGGISAKDAGTLAADMGTTSERLRSVRKRNDATEFALSVRHHTPQPLHVSVPLGFLESQDRMKETAYNLLLEQNRFRYCAAYEDAEEDNRPFQIAGRRKQKTGNETAEAQPPSPVDVSNIKGSPTDTDTSVPDQSRSSNSTTVRDKPSPPQTPTPLGRGGKDHRYLQAFVQELGQSHGFKATIEKQLPNGGFVDVFLSRDDMKVACEISVSTNADHEAGNVLKCLEADIDRMIVVAATDKQLKAIRKAVMRSSPQHSNVQIEYLKRTEVAEFLASNVGDIEPAETTVKGYRVRVRSGRRPASDTRQRIIQKIVNQ